MYTLYLFLKDFSSPLATVIASITAATITWRFGNVQHKLAEQQAVTAKKQANTSLDQLKFNLFKQRYDIYLSIKSYLQMLLERPSTENFLVSELQPLYVIVDESRFFFSGFITKWLQELMDNDIGPFLTTRHDPSSKAFLDATNRLIVRLKDLPSRFLVELEFPQLTRRG